MSMFSEPWRIRETQRDTIETANGRAVLQSVLGGGSPHIMRAINAVNATAGMADPAAEIARLQDELQTLRASSEIREVSLRQEVASLRERLDECNREVYTLNRIIEAMKGTQR